MKRGARLLLSVSLLSARALGQTTENVCVPAFEQGQELRAEGRLLEAEKRFEQCSVTDCPDFVRKDCSVWVKEVSEELPSVVIRVQSNLGVKLESATVVDGRTQAQNGSPVSLDPGFHELEVTAPNYARVRQTFELKRKAKNTVITIVMKAMPLATQPRTAVASSSWSPFASVALGTTILTGAALTTWGFFGVRGLQLESDLSGRCGTRCTDADLDPVYRSYLLADVSLGVAVGGAILSGILWSLHAGRRQP
jgi:hypothetical protein